MMRRDPQSHALLQLGNQLPPRPDLLPDPSNFAPAKAPLVPCSGPIPLACEHLCGVPARWDDLTEQNAARSIDVLSDLVESLTIRAA